MKTLAPILLVLAAAAAPIHLRADDTIKVGEYGSLTGKEASFGQSAHMGITMAIEEANAAGGVLGRKLELITEDNQTMPGQSATAAKKLISRDKVIALIGEVSSGRSLEAAPIAQAARIPMIAPAATNPKVTQSGTYIFRVCFIDSFQAKVIAKFVANELKARKVAILSSVSNAYSVGLAKYFRENFTAGGGTIGAEQKYSEGDKDFRAQLTAIAAAGCDVVFVPGYYTEAALIVRQGRELGLAMPFVGGDGWVSDQLLQIGGDAMNGCYYSTHFSLREQQPRGPLVRGQVPAPAGTTRFRTPSPPSGMTRSACWSTPSGAPARPRSRGCATPSPRPRTSRARPARRRWTRIGTPPSRPPSSRSGTAS